LLEKDISAKQQARTQLDKLNVLHQWLDDHFSSLMGTMEKHVLTKVYHEFNSLFVNWFNRLIEDEVLAARLDEEFSPVVQQNGYDTAVENLSGGEKTACALAYRLALNKVITALRSTISTKGLVILDEPTDGFSADQVSRMRDVLEQLKARQIILVSHEAMIESLSDHVLRVVKEGHESRVVV
jgi:exonuclease SbcC